ncbi:MAG: hypothetical protein NTW19_06615 [Planctomycetota bacterium]|nr:hypothetical protein [Planctomycetota bacterium]
MDLRRPAWLLVACLVAVGCETAPKLAKPDPYRERKPKAAASAKAADAGKNAATQPSAGGGAAVGSHDMGKSASQGTPASTPSPTASPASSSTSADASGKSGEGMKPAAPSAMVPSKPANVGARPNGGAAPSSPAAAPVAARETPARVASGNTNPVAASNSLNPGGPGGSAPSTMGVTPAQGLASDGAKPDAGRAAGSRSPSAPVALAPGSGAAAARPSSNAVGAPNLGNVSRPPAAASAKLPIDPQPLGPARAAVPAPTVAGPGLVARDLKSSPPAAAPTLSLDANMLKSPTANRIPSLPAVPGSSAKREPTGLVTRFLDSIEPSAASRQPSGGTRIAANVAPATQPAATSLPGTVVVPGAMTASSPLSSPEPSATITLASLSRGTSAFVAMWSADSPKGVALSRADAARLVAAKPRGQFVVVDLPGQDAAAWRRIIDRANAGLGAVDWLAPAGAEEAARRERLARRAADQEADLAAREKLSSSVFQFLLGPQTQPATPLARPANNARSMPPPAHRTRIR